MYSRDCSICPGNSSWPVLVLVPVVLVASLIPVVLVVDLVPVLFFFALVDLVPVLLSTWFQLFWFLPLSLFQLFCLSSSPSAASSLLSDGYIHLDIVGS